MKNDLIDRYIYAVTKRMNPKIREDVQNELYGLVDDMLAERCGEVTPTEKDIRVVLTELGSPQELYAKYDEDSKKCLIGQPYYSTYKFVLKTVLICMAAGLTIGSLIIQMMEPQELLVAAVEYMGRLWNGSISVFAVLTIVFAVFYHKGIKINDPFNFDDLPPVPQKKQEISKWECIVGIGFSVVFLTLLLAVPQVFSINYEQREWIPIFNADVIRDNWYIILGFTAAGIIREVVKLLEKRYNQTVLLTTIGTNAVSALLTAWWLTTKNLLNPAFEQEMVTLLAGESEIAVRFMTNFQNLFLAVIIFALAIDTAETVIKTLKK